MEQQGEPSTTSTNKHGGKWTKTVDLHGFRADEVKVKVNPVYHNLEIVAKRQTNPWHQPQVAQKSNKFTRILNLPENIDMSQLSVNLNIESGKLMVKAPFQGREDLLSKEQCHRQQEPPENTTCINVPVMWKSDLASPFSATRCCLVGCPSQQQQSSAQVSPSDLSKCTVEEYLRLLKLSASVGGTYQPTSSSGSSGTLPCCCTVNKFLATEIVPDEKSQPGAGGKWKLFFDINAVGFRREEIQVFFQEKERILVVEMRHDTTMKQKSSVTAPSVAGGAGTQSGVSASVKHVREEIMLPEWLSGKEMRFRLMDTGVLRVQMPCLREPWPKTSEEQQRWS
jgi:HSP20 family molecular chaperone IbpA